MDKLLTGRKVYYFRWIMHNYSTPYAISILKNLLPSLKPGARVIINDHCLREAGQENPWDDKIMRRMDMVMLSLLNAQERTEAEFRELFRQVDEGFVFKVSLLLMKLHWSARSYFLSEGGRVGADSIQGVTRPKGCRMSIIEAVWKPNEGETKEAVIVEEAETAEPKGEEETTKAE